MSSLPVVESYLYSLRTIQHILAGSASLRGLNEQFLKKVSHLVLRGDIASCKDDASRLWNDWCRICVVLKSDKGTNRLYLQMFSSSCEIASPLDYFQDPFKQATELWLIIRTSELSRTYPSAFLLVRSVTNTIVHTKLLPPIFRLSLGTAEYDQVQLHGLDRTNEVCHPLSLSRSSGTIFLLRMSDLEMKLHKIHAK